MITRFRSGVSATAFTIAIAAGAIGPAVAQNAQAPAQPSAPRTQGPGPGDEPIQIGPQQLRDFQLTPRERIVTQPTPTPGPPATRNAAPFSPQPAPPPRPAQRQATPQQAPAQQRPAPGRETPAPAAAQPAPEATPAPTAAPAPAPEQAAPQPATPSAPVADNGASALPQQAPAPGPTSDATVTSGPPLWVYFLTLVTFGLLGYFYWLRRQAVEKKLLALGGPRGASARTGTAARSATPAAAPETPREPPAPRPAPIPRAWIDIEVVPERVSADPNESVVEFELILKNSGASTAENIKLQARMFPSTPEQDQEITAFYRMRPGGEQRTLDAPPIPAGEELRVKGRVELPGDRMKALRVEERLLLIPLIAFNVFYDWGSTRSGQSSRSFIVGRERTDPGDKMAPFRLDLGARIYRTVGQRPYKLERRV